MEAHDEILIDGIRVRFEHCRSGLFIGTSPDMKGLMVVERTRETAVKMAPVLIGHMRKAQALVNPKETSNV